MKIDTVLIIQIIMIFLCVASIMVYVRIIYRKTVSYFYDEYGRSSLIQILQYLKKLQPKDYLVYEKYKIWWYYVYF
ncbi:hypothetical protein ACJDU8_01325 [Clostridium sp. WILCCON 0269]|uniref:Uncharacterized protein n=1 Tax=Candidatus Clostridium eludens TaxID=3381663 RepID=A0ABW8SEU2_9CLOT